MVKVLVLATDYPNNEGSVTLRYIHTRNIEYIKNNIKVTVLNFSSNKNYTIDGVDVISLDSFENFNKRFDFDILISHAPNVRNHVRFITKYGSKFCKFVIFFHGHEVLRESTAYPKPFHYKSSGSKIKRVLKDYYDTFKFIVIRNIVSRHKNKIELVFVSEWMKNEFDRNVKLSSKNYPNSHIIYNSVGSIFEEKKYTPQNLQFDFITIRSNIDGSKYCIDIVYKLAQLLPTKKFLIIGKGDFFNHFPKPPNITYIQKQLTHVEIIDQLNQSRFALMPTRTDSQGVMSCEFSAFGIPLVTSDIEVCKLIFEDVRNVWLINNENISVNTLDVLPDYNDIDIIKSEKFSISKTVQKEIDLIKSLF